MRTFVDQRSAVGYRTLQLAVKSWPRLGVDPVIFRESFFLERFALLGKYYFSKEYFEHLQIERPSLSSYRFRKEYWW